MQQKRRDKDIGINPEYLKKIQNFRLLDNDFMVKVFEDNIPAVERVLKIVLKDEGLKVLNVQVENVVMNLFGHSVTFDVQAKDSNDVFYDIEIQRKDRGATAKRARYHSALIDANSLLEPSEDHTNLPETYVIFICEHDVRKKGRPLYCYERVDISDGTLLEDKAHIIYVNGAYRGDDDLGKLMSDFRAKKASEMHFPELAERVQYLKETKEGQNAMCRMMEDLAKKSVKEEHVRLIHMNREKGMDDQCIADFLGESLEYVQRVPRKATPKN